MQLKPYTSMQGEYGLVVWFDFVRFCLVWYDVDVVVREGAFTTVWEDENGAACQESFDYADLERFSCLVDGCYALIFTDPTDPANSSHLVPFTELQDLAVFEVGSVFCGLELQAWVFAGLPTLEEWAGTH